MKKAPLLSVILPLLLSSVLVNGQSPETTAKTLKTSVVPEARTTRNSDPKADAQKNYEAGVAFYESGKLDEAIAALKESTKQRPDDPQAHFLLGMVYSQSKSYKDAAESFKRALRYKPDWAEAQFRYGMMSYVLGRRSQSLDSYKRLLELNSPLANTLYRVIKSESDPAVVAETARADINMSALKATDSNAVPVSVSQQASGQEASLVSSSETKAPATSTVEAKKSSSANESSAPASLTAVYRIGVGDVLDIRLLNSSINRSSLYSVIDGGLIDMPIAGGAIQVAGLTTDEVQTRVAAELKRRAVEEGAQVSVGVRQYASHTVIITGLVSSQGTKILRREAVPLYVILAEAQPRLDAARVNIMRSGGAARTLDLSDSEALNFPVRSGDVINVTARQQEFYYIAGRVNFPGQKSFQSGITLLQAILAAGGVEKQHDNSIELSREGDDGHLSTTKFKLKEIKSGKVQDPKLRPGDRIEVMN